MVEQQDAFVSIATENPLPPGLQYQRFPAELERRLSALPAGCLRAEIDGSFVLFDGRIRVIFDVFAD